MYESRTSRPIPRPLFVRRVLLHFAAGAALILVSLVMGMAGYAYYEHMRWLDAFLNATMLLGGMGPVNAPQTDGGKLFAGLFALYAGPVFLAVAGLVIAPIAHRILHKFHWEEDKG